MDNGPHLFEQRGRIGGLENVAAEPLLFAAAWRLNRGVE